MRELLADAAIATETPALFRCPIATAAGYDERTATIWPCVASSARFSGTNWPIGEHKFQFRFAIEWTARPLRSDDDQPSSQATKVCPYFNGSVTQ